jgi:hypothetical protein
MKDMRRMMRGPILLMAILACGAAGLGVLPAMAQQQPGGWQSETLRPGQTLPGAQQGAQQSGQQGSQQSTQGFGGTPAQTQQELPPNTTVVPRTRGELKSGGVGQVSLLAMLTEDGQGIEQGLVWRVYRDIAGPDGKARIVSTSREPNPTLKLDAGDYFVNVALGRANLTRKITVTGERASQERFVLNAGGLRLIAVLGKGEVANDKTVSYDIFSDERDQYGQRVRIMSGLRPGTVVRLNAGIYSIVSTYGDANAVARSDVTVEAGKLTEGQAQPSGGQRDAQAGHAQRRRCHRRCAMEHRHGVGRGRQGERRGAAHAYPGTGHLCRQRQARRPSVSARIHRQGRRFRAGRSGDALSGLGRWRCLLSRLRHGRAAQRGKQEDRNDGGEVGDALHEGRAIHVSDQHVQMRPGQLSSDSSHDESQSVESRILRSPAFDSWCTAWAASPAATSVTRAPVTLNTLRSGMAASPR